MRENEFFSLRTTAPVAGKPYKPFFLSCCVHVLSCTHFLVNFLFAIPFSCAKIEMNYTRAFFKKYPK